MTEAHDQLLRLLATFHAQIRRGLPVDPWDWRTTDEYDEEQAAAMLRHLEPHIRPEQETR